MINKKFKIVFAGTIEISKHVLESLYNKNEIEIVGVICQPDKISGRKKEIKYCSVKKFCLEKNLKLFQPEKVIQIYDEISKLQADFLITCAFGQFIAEKILLIFKNCFNFHASILPKYRGGSPIQKAIASGEKESGICLMQMIKKMDAGDVYCVEKFKIDLNDDAGIVFEKATNAAIKIIENNLISVLNNKIIPTPQDDEKVSFAYNLTNEEEKINFDQENLKVHNFIRSLSPKPIAYTYLNNIRVKIKKTELVTNVISFDCKPGQIIECDKKGIIVACKNNSLIRILQLQREGKKMVDAATYYKNESIFKNKEIFR